MHFGFLFDDVLVRISDIMGPQDANGSAPKPCSVCV